jgi:hypothetical protein
MATLNDRNGRLFDANQRAEHLIALGGDRGMARQIAAMEIGLIGGDRIELEDREEQRADLPLFLPAIPGDGFPLFIPGEMAEIPSMLSPISASRARGTSGRRRSTPPPRL